MPPVELLLIALALTLLVAPFVPGLRPLSSRLERPVLLVLVALAALNYFVASRYGFFVHRWDLFHTMMGTKYFAELGYDGLYECAIGFDAETHRHYGKLRGVRDLATLRIVPVAKVLQESDCDRRFSPERKRDFVADLAVFNELAPRSRWPDLFRDKGYNGSPFYTFVVSLFSRTLPFGRRTFFLLGLIDVALIVGAFAVAARAFGARVAAFAFVFFCVNFPNRFLHMGGSLLRFDYFAWLLVGFSLLRLGRPAGAGAFLAAASMIRIFPAAFAAAVFARFGFEALRNRSLAKDHVRFAGGFAATAAIAFLFSVSFGHGLRNWSEFAENLEVHTGRSAGFRIGLPNLITFHGETTAADHFVSYADKAAELRERRPLHLAVAGALLAGALWLCPRLDRTGGPILLGMVAIYGLFSPTRYYYSVLALLALVTPGGETSWRAQLALLFLVSGIAWAVSATNDFAPFLYNYLFSFCLLVYFIVLLGLSTSAAFTGKLAAPMKPTVRRRRSVPWLVGGGAAIVLAVLFVARGSPGSGEERLRGIHCCDADVLLRPEDLPEVAALVRDLWSGRAATGAEKLPARMSTPAQAVYVAVRREGRRLAEAWETRGTTLEALARVLAKLRKDARTAGADVLEIDLTHSYRELDRSRRDDERKLQANIRRGVDGLEISAHGVTERHAPTTVIATNRSHGRLIELFRERHRLDERAMREAQYWLFDAEQLLVPTAENAEPRLLFRGNEIVPIDAVRQDRVRFTADLAAQWLVNNVHADGRMTYLYWPSASAEAPANNMIRQWMATVALERVAARRSDPALWEKIERNIDYNLAQFYEEENGHGLIVEPGDRDVKLGAIALAAIALREHPRSAKWSPKEQALAKTVDSLWNADGSFRTFYRPKHRTDNQNFYPGEALLYWATRLEREPDDTLRKRFLASFDYYRKWHLDPRHRNPAFVPWHTQADYRVWKETRDGRLRDFIFEMNDWLLGVQEWSDDPRYPDTQGRFYDPTRPFGPPHSSSTGVYLEGLIDAFALAREVNDAKRAEAYRVAIVRGLRSVMQLQFEDDTDMFYVGRDQRRFVHGGIRTTEYDNQIRCDNVQHNLMGLLNILDRFGAADYRHETAAAEGVPVERLEFKVKKNPRFFLEPR